MKSEPILIVDDQEDQRYFLKSVLKQLRCEILEACSGKEAFEILEQKKIALILLDIQMPLMNGIDTAKHIRAIKLCEQTPILFMSASRQSENDIFTGYQSSAVDYLLKPLAPPIVLSKVKVFLDLHHQKKELEKRNQELQDDLNLASEFQRSILPKVYKTPFLDIATRYIPYGGVSGDIYEMSLNREGDLCVFLGDATGHGIAAAFMTMMIQIGVGNLRHDLPTHEAIRTLNRLLASRETGKSVTGICLKISSLGHLSATHAGHPPLIIIPHAHPNEPVIFQEGGCPLGMFFEEVVPYMDENYLLREGDKVFLYTDGVIEWSNAQGELFGIHRMSQFLSKHHHLQLDSILSQLIESLHIFSQGLPCKDDLTVLAFTYQSCR